jgi:hypothetical protein
MKLTIIPVDGAVYKDGVSYSDLDLLSAPSDVHALQWDGAAGWIEFTSPIPNQEITELPAWTNACLVKWDEAEAARIAAAEVAEQAAANKQG